MSVDLTVVATLNGESANITIYEDLDGSGTADNQETISVSGSGTTNYTLSTLQGNGSEYWPEIDLSTTDGISTAEIDSISIDTSPNLTTIALDEVVAGLDFFLPTGAVTLESNVNLNNQSIDVTIYEDTNQDGTAENTQTISLVDGVDNTVATDLDGGASNDYWLEVSFSSNNAEESPQVNSLQLNVDTLGIKTIVNSVRFAMTEDSIQNRTKFVVQVIRETLGM